jgi:hypothetical protein
MEKTARLHRELLSVLKKMMGTYKGGRVFDGSARLLSRALVSQSAPVACRTLSLSLSVRYPPLFLPVSTII